MSRLIGTVLIVDDIPAIRKLIAGALAGLVDAVIEAEDGVEALALVEEHSPDLVFLDLALPGMSGIDILRAIRGNPAVSDIPVVIVSALATSDMAGQARETGATAILEKPFRPMQLRTLAERLARGEPAA